MKRICTALLVLSAVAGTATAQTSDGAATRAYWANKRAAANESATPSRGTARAWCMVKKNGEYWCNGPLQNGGWGNTLQRALAMVDCPNGQGYTPTVGTGGQSFNCGRELRSTEQEVPTYDPFYNRDKKY